MAPKKTCVRQKLFKKSVLCNLYATRSFSFRTSSEKAKAKSPIQTDFWFHFALVSYGPPYEIAVFVNGELKAHNPSRSDPDGDEVEAGQLGQLALGRSIEQSTIYSDVIVDELKFYNKPLNTDNILLVYSPSI